MRRKIRLIWHTSEYELDRSVIHTFKTDCICLPLDSAGVKMQRDGLIPDLLGGEWVEDDVEEGKE